MPITDATSFCREFDRYQDAADQEPVRVTSQGRVIGGFLSSRDLDHYESLKRREQQVYVAGAFPDDVLRSIAEAEYLKPGV